MLEYELNEKLIKESINFKRFKTRLYINNLNEYSYDTNQEDKSFTNKNLEIQEYLDSENDLIIVFHYRI